MMSGIGGKDTKPEMILRQGLHARGFRYRLHVGDLPGKPDMVFPAHSAVIEVNGCFWHGHDCHLFKWPATRSDWWRAKIEGNRARDDRNQLQLRNLGWRAAIVWECALKGKHRKDSSEVLDLLSDWLHGVENEFVIRGTAS